MANANSTQDVQSPLIADDVINEIGKKSAQLYALIVTITGEGFDSFKECSDPVQGNYLWLCSELSEDIHNLACKL